MRANDEQLNDLRTLELGIGKHRDAGFRMVFLMSYPLDQSTGSNVMATQIPNRLEVKEHASAQSAHNLQPPKLPWCLL